MDDTGGGFHGVKDLPDIAMTNIVCGMAKQGGRGGGLYCAIWQSGEGAIKEVLNAKNSINLCTVPE